MCDLNSVFFCTQCGNELRYSIPRKLGKQRPAGHLKRIWCEHCQNSVNFAETKEYSKYSKLEFMFEYNNGNFTKDGDRKMPFGIFKDKMYKKGIKM